MNFSKKQIPCGPILLLGLSLISLSTIAAADQTPEHTSNDIRVLIDVSGSMKFNDPDNLRAPALRLLTGLLPKGTDAGVWTFGRYVNMLVKHDTVNASWKKKAMLGSKEIHSLGLFTDIEATLDKASRDWKTPDDKVRRSIILLTDGLVDVSKDSDENAASRSRILAKLLPRLQHAGATINTIALSGDADEVLLEQLAVATNGWYEKADSAETLERIFLRMFEKSATPDTLPLVDNKVLVDSSIDELTLLIFRDRDAPPSQITDPDGTTFGENDAPPHVLWHHEMRYDLITIDKPHAGIWRVLADVDLDNRVMVVTNLRVIASALPNNISLGDEFNFFVRLTQQDEVITQTEFLHFIKVSLDQQDSHGEQWEWRLLDNGRKTDETPDDGTYSTHIGETLGVGQHTLTVNIDGTTFKRVHTQTVNVYDSPVMAVINPSSDLEAMRYTLNVTPRAGMVDPDSLEIIATVTDDDENQEDIPVPRINQNEWKLEFSDELSLGPHTVELYIEGNKPNGKPVDHYVGPMTFGSDIKNPDDETEEENAPVITEEEEPADTKAMDQTNWLYVAIQIVIFNLLAAAGIFFGYKKWRKAAQAEPAPNPWDDLAYE